MVGVGGVERLPDGYVAPQQLSRGQFIYAYSLVTSLFFAWGFAYGLLDSLNKYIRLPFVWTLPLGLTLFTQALPICLQYFEDTVHIHAGGLFWSVFPMGAMGGRLLPAGESNINTDHRDKGAFMRKVGYKKGIYLGLTLYSLGAIFYWPVAVKKSYPGFVVRTFWISMGLSTLEVAANTYLIVLGDPAQGAFRLTFSQAFNGIGAFAGPLIASEYFFKGENATSLKNVQWTYLAVSIFGVILLILFYFAQLPEIDEGALSDTLENQDDVKPIYKQWHTIFGFFAQFAYVGAQVAVATFAVNLFSDTPSIGYTASKGALYYSYCQ
ncbi:hypothetical protein FRB91_005368 [Serendipita sp. 411]|nr:hypothetical protein FRB91_005368 [Serendipita sp. 411]